MLLYCSLLLLFSYRFERKNAATENIFHVREAAPSFVCDVTKSERVIVNHHIFLCLGAERYILGKSKKFISARVFPAFLSRDMFPLVPREVVIKSIIRPL